MNASPLPQPTAITCPHCGAAVQGRISICPSCGIHLEKSTRKKISVRFWQLLLVVLIIFLALCAALLFFEGSYYVTGDGSKTKEGYGFMLMLASILPLGLIGLFIKEIIHLEKS